MTKDSKNEDQYPDEEAQRRFEQALKGGLKTPPKPLKERPSKGSEKKGQRG